MKRNGFELWFFRVILLIVLYIVLYTLYESVPSNTHYYCDQLNIYPSDEEYIEFAVRNESGRMNIDGSDKSFKTFHAMNPGCCDVGRGDDRSLLEKMFGKPRVVTVHLVYKVNQNETEESGTKYYENVQEVDVCGNYMGTGGDGSLNERQFNTIINSKYRK